MDKISERSSDLNSRASAEQISSGADVDRNTSLAPPPLQLKTIQAQKEESKSDDVEIAEEPFQLAASGDDSPPDDPGQSNSGSDKPNNTGLPTQLKSGIENLSGFSLDDVKVHRNSDKPAQLQAHAYAQGTDIHLGPGQEKHLPHEAWHVVQQKQGRVQPTTQLKAFNINDDAGLEKEADVMGAKALQMKEIDTSHQGLTASAPFSAVVQRVAKEVIVTGLSHIVKMDGKTLQGSDLEQIEIMQGQEIVIETDGMVRSRRGPNRETYKDQDELGDHIYKWFPVLNMDGRKIQDGYYIRKDVFEEIVHGPEKSSASKGLDTVTSVVDEVTAVPAALIGNEGVTGVADALNGKTVFTNTSGQTPKLDCNGDKILDDDGNPIMEYNTSNSERGHAANMGIVGDSMTGVTGILGLAKGFADLGDPEATTADLIETALEIEKGAMKTGEAVSKLVHTASGSSDATTASKFGSTFEGYGAAFSGIKEAFMGMRALVNLVNEHQDYSTQDKARAAGEIAVHTLETAKSIVLSIKAFMELVNGSASGSLMAAVPGLDIAISGVTIIMDGYYLIVSNSSRKVMNERMTELADDSEHSKEELTQAADDYRRFDAAISNKKTLIEQHEKKKEEADSNSKKDKIQGKIDKLENDIVLIESKKASNGVEKEEVAEFAMATELRDANRKRVTRQGIHIAAEFTKIAGAIATLTGVGAMAGGIIKGAAAAGELSLPAARLAKQAARNRKAKEKAGQDVDDMNILRPNKTFQVDESKSSAAKKDYRTNQVKFLIGLTIKLLYLRGEAQTEAEEHVKKYMTATGVNETKLYKENGNPQKQVSMLLEALNQRELE